MTGYEEEIKKELIRYTCDYLLSGKIVDQKISASMLPEGIEKTHVDLDTLLKLHYILHPKVINFVIQLPERIRRIRTETKTREYPSKGLVRGRINWGQTLKERHSRCINDTSFFICSNPQINYNLPENLLLKKTLTIIYETLTEYEETFLNENYSWIKDTWGKSEGNSEDLILSLKELIEKNIHINRIKADKIQVSEKMMAITENSRNELYKDAAELYHLYFDVIILKNHGKVAELLSETLIIPEKQDKLYQVYVFFKTLEIIDGYKRDKLRLKIIGKERKTTAEYIDLEQNTKIQIFYDTTKGSKFKFKSEDFTWKTSKDVLNKHYGSRVTEEYTDRPDIIIKDLEKPSNSIIVEVKHTDKPGYVGTGVRECVQYLKRCKDEREDTLVFDNFGSGYNGVVVIKKHPTELNNDLDRLSDSPKIKIFDYSDLKQGEYKNFLKKALRT